ncbi:MAG TPA: hypothetical protein VEC12_11780 [Bacteroidia bacterium]|nr:hypothetical protein [Bacteroidia bacterium]
MRKVIAILFIVAAATACKKDGDKYTVKGRLLKSCDNPVPVKNFTVYLYNDYKSSSNTCNSGQIATATTNENGEFELSYEKTCSSGKISLEYDVSFSSTALVDGIEPKKDYDLGDIYKMDNGFYTVKIKTNQAYTSSDTLFYDITNKGPNDSNYQYVIGPFVDGATMDTLFKSVYKDLNYVSGGSVTNSAIKWIFKSNQTVYAKSRQPQQFYIEPCKKYNEVILDISK